MTPPAGRARQGVGEAGLPGHSQAGGGGSAGRVAGLSPYYEDGSVTIYHGDCRDILPSLEPVALCITDPPYRSLDIDVIRGTTTRLVGRGNAAGRKPSAANRLGNESDWFDTMPEPELSAVLLGILGRLTPEGALYVFADVKTGLGIFPKLPTKNVLVWDKLRLGMGYSWRRMHEWIAYCPREKHTLRSQARGDILRCAGVTDKRHPTEKPIGVLGPIIANSSDHGDAVLDPFCGSGSTLEAACLLGRKAIGIEREERYCEIAAQRCAQGVLAL